MKTTHILRLVTIAAALLASLFGASIAAGDSTGAEDATQSSKPALAKGMSAATVRQLIGNPVEVTKIETNGASGESWIYRRKMGTEVTQEAVLVEKVPAFVGLGYGNKDNIDLVEVPAQRLKRTTLTQVTALLMVEDTLVFARQWIERDTAYEN